MSSDSEQRPPTFSAEADSSSRVGESVSEYREKPGVIDTDTRLASAGETEAMWPGRPARRSVMRSLARSATDSKSRKEAAAYRGDHSTSHTRRDLLTGDWTIFAPKRNERPNDYESKNAPASVAVTTQPAVDADCPFCSGAESRTPEAVWSAKLGDQGAPPIENGATRFAGPHVEVVAGEQDGWDVRVVPNKFPAVSPSEAATGAHVDRHELFPITDVVGGHEVIIESALHAESITEYDPAMVYMTLLAFRDRIRHWRQVPGINYISVFKNCGPEAGASLRHSHSQLIATSLMPHHVRTTMLRCEHHRARTGCSLACDLLRAELAERSRLIDRTDSFVAFCPFASRFGGLIRMTSVEHQPHFDLMTDTSLDQLASFLWRVLSWVKEAFPGKAFNYLLHTCPPGCQQPDAFQWSLDVFPRLSKTAGFEWSCDCMINSLLPESAALRYREIARKHDPRNVLLTR
ncbi:Galactose-1-phosphate uridylyltransferase [Stieleria maiorica]|uniref:Galactose-1-phosphate uridylyltransferase n=1 Tax=Stieleria maiorica TaxID=2795974 RepID=A0A5B9MJ33_9BACT|nr:DUF4921 family protein [Stieleria maiorica]QEG01219.1 Galactose-1-phosphate uridylyltransferase [Stieleria maiorica]